MPTDALRDLPDTPAPVHGFLHADADGAPSWRAAPGGRQGARFERLMFLGGHGDPNAAGRGAPADQAAGALAQLEQTVESLGGRGADIVKLVVFHTGQTEKEESDLLREIRRRLPCGTAPVISLVALPRLADPGSSLLIKGVAVDDADGGAPRLAVNPGDCAPWPADAGFSAGLRCGELVFVGAQSARDGRGALLFPDDIAAQAQQTIDNIAAVLADLGCDRDDVVKLNTWYVGFGTDEDWRRAAEVRSKAFRFPGPCATGVPVPARYPDGALLRQECLALRATDGSRLPRALSWPLGHWDWPMPVSFQQGIRVGRFVVLGGQYSMDERGLAVDPDDMPKQTANTLGFIRRILQGLGADLQDLIEVTNFYKHDAAGDGTPLRHTRLGAQQVPTSEVPLSTMGLERVTLEVEGYAVLPQQVDRAG